MSAGVQETPLKREGSPVGTGSGTTTVLLVSREKEQLHRELRRVTSGGGGSNKRLNFVRTGSFRNKHKIKQQDSIDGTNMSTRGRSPGDTRAWRIRHFGYYDVQSVTVDRLSYQVAQGDPTQRLKKHTGASAAVLTTDIVEGGDLNSNEAEVGNDLVAVCPAFKNEIGSEKQNEDNVIERFRCSMSQDKKMRLYSRERVVLDSYFCEDCEKHEEIDEDGSDIFTIQSGNTYPIEFVDFGACYYRNYFYNKEHQNFAGFDDGLGPVVISLKREKVDNKVIHNFSIGQPSNERLSTKYQYRIIVRTSELQTLRGTIMEESIPSSIKSGSLKGIPPREVIEYVTQGDLQTSSLKLTKSDEKTMRELMRLDEQELNNRIKVGVLYCKAGQTNEEEWYNNEHGSPAFLEFLELIGEKVKMKGFNKYRAQLDNKTDTTGEYSVYTEYENNEIMFHVSTLLPFTPVNKQQLLRKRHIGNDIVTLIFQEPGSEPFSPKSIRSHFQHIFIVVRAKNPNTPFTEYQVSVSRSNDVPYFGPPIPEHGIFQKSERFRNFLLAKLINACNAALHSDKLYAMAARTRKQYLSDLCKESTTSITIDQAGGGALGRLFGRRKDRTGLVSPLLFTPGSMTWSVSIIMRHWKPLPFSEEHDFNLECTLCLAPDVLTFVGSDKVAILNIPTRDISGYSQDKCRLNLFYDHCYCVSIECHDNEDDLQDLCKRLTALTHAQEAILLEFGRSVISGLLGFTIDQDGTVVKVDGLAKMRGLQRGARVLQVEDKLVCANSSQVIANLLLDRNRSIVKAFVIPPVTKKERPCLRRFSIDWEGVWSARPQAANECNDTECSENTSNKQPSPQHDDSNTECSSSHARRFSADALSNGSISPSKRRRSRPDHLQVIDPYQSDDNIYDRLMNYATRGSVSPSAKSTGSAGPLSPSSVTSGKSYSRMKISHNKAVRQSVLQLANNIMDHYGEDGESSERFSWTPQPAEHHIDEYSPYVNTHISQSTNIPDRKHTASPLSLIRKPPTPGALGEKSFENMPQIGQVSELKKRFSQQHGSGSSRRLSKKSSHVSITVAQDQEPYLHQNECDPTKSGSKRASSNSSGGSNRPMSWDSSEVLDVKTSPPRGDRNRGDRGESLPPPDRPSTDALFQRNTQARQPIRQKHVATPLSLKVSSESAPPTSNTTAEDNIVESMKHHEYTPILLSQFSGEDSPTKLLDEVLEQFEDKSQETNISNLTVKARTQLWELKAHTQTLPRSFKTRTKSQPCSPLKGTSESPATPTGSTTSFTFNHGTTPNSQKKDDIDSMDNRSAQTTYYRSRGPPISPSASPKHRTLPFPQKPPSLALKSHTHNGYSNEDVTEGTKKFQKSLHKKSLQSTLSDSHIRSPGRCHSEKQFRFDIVDSEDQTPLNDQLSWDSVMGDITSYCRSVAEWVKQTEDAVVESGTYSPPSNGTISPTCSDTFSLATTSVQSEPIDNYLLSKVDILENKIEQESESNKELRIYLKKMEKQITDLQKRQNKIITKV